MTPAAALVVAERRFRLRRRSRGRRRSLAAVATSFVAVVVAAVAVLVFVHIRIRKSAVVVVVVAATTRQQQRRRQLYPTRIVPFPDNNDEPSSETNVTQLTDVGLPRSAYLVRTTDDWTVVVPEPQRRERHQQQSVVSTTTTTTTSTSKRRQSRYRYYRLLDKTSHQASRRGCLAATNGGPFDADGTPVGDVVVDGRVVTVAASRIRRSPLATSSPDDDTHQYVGIGIAIAAPPNRTDVVDGGTNRTAFPTTTRTTGQRRRYWIVGRLRDASRDDEELRVEQFVTGFDWLVYDGKNVAVDDGDDRSDVATTTTTTTYNTTTTTTTRRGASTTDDRPRGLRQQRTARTAVGIDRESRLMMVVADGCDVWYAFL